MNGFCFNYIPLFGCHAKAHRELFRVAFPRMLGIGLPLLLNYVFLSTHLREAQFQISEIGFSDLFQL